VPVEEEILMWRKQDDPKPLSPVAEVPPPPRVEPVRSVAGLTAEVVQPSGGLIMSSLVIKGEIRGREDLYIDGEVQGSINLSDGRVTIGPHGRISADIEAREIVVRGTVKGTLLARERVEIGRTGDVRGDIVTARIAVEDGAQIHGKVDVPRTEEPRWNRSQAKALDVVSAVPVKVESTGD
jgi:cytoskeletal protein CcmA (bactofilin family)